MNEKDVQREGADIRFDAAIVAGVLAAGLSFVGGLAAGRLLYEGLFPDLLWLGRPLPGLLVAALTAILGWLLWHWLTRALDNRQRAGTLSRAGLTAGWGALLPFLPLALNLAYLLDPAVHLQWSRTLFLAGIWLAIVFLVRLLTKPAHWRWLAYGLIVAFLLPVFLATMGQSVGTADTFEFQVVVPQMGIVHPTGYPLYLLLTKPFTWLPFNDMAWRVNLATVLFGLIAVCLLYTLIRRLTGWMIPAMLAAIIFGLTPTFWSQSIEAEVYSLHALIVAAILLLMRELGDWHISGRGSQLPGFARPAALQPFIATVLLALALGLGLTNHLTTVLLLPAAGIAVFLALREGRYDVSPFKRLKAVALVAGAFLLPLLLYAYLPIRWQAVNGEAMGLDRFIDWVIGGRFSGALQLSAWISDATRYQVVGRLLLDEWPIAWGLPLIVVGLGYLFFSQWRYALLLFISWLAYIFYGLNYYVPDLAVFLIPAYLIMAIFWALGIVALMQLVARILPARGARFAIPLRALVLVLAVTPGLLAAARQTWSTVDSSGPDGRSQWGKSVLELPIPDGAAILADSDKFPPLYYLQQAEGLRPDLDIIMLPDESAYRTELEARLASGQPVYLARFLPGLEGIYHLRSLGPLVEVSQEPLVALPAPAEPLGLTFGPIRLIGYELAAASPFATDESALTLYWTTAEPVDEALHVYTRWVGQTFAGPAQSQHPAGNTYPTVAWRTGEVVPDYHAMSRSVDFGTNEMTLQVALAPPFTPAETLPWQTIATVEGPLAAPQVQFDPRRMQLGPLQVDGISLQQPTGRQGLFTALVSGYANAPESLFLALVPSGAEPADGDWQTVNPIPAPGGMNAETGQQRVYWARQMDSQLAAGSYDLLAAHAEQEAICSWLARPTDRCLVGQVELGEALLPAEAINFEDKIAMLSLDLAETTLRPGGELPLTITWQALAPLDENYTVFIQVVDQDDRIVGQIDAWPLQGTYPTDQWSVGEIIDDPYRVPLAEELPPGPYRLYVGWYLLETLRRLPVIDQDGQALDDKVTVPGLTVPE